jgi:hypothetical protein
MIRSFDPIAVAKSIPEGRSVKWEFVRTIYLAEFGINFAPLNARNTALFLLQGAHGIEGFLAGG